MHSHNICGKALTGTLEEFDENLESQILSGLLCPRRVMRVQVEFRGYRFIVPVNEQETVAVRFPLCGDYLPVFNSTCVYVMCCVVAHFGGIEALSINLRERSCTHA